MHPALSSEPGVSRSAYDQYLARTYVPELDGLRAFSVLLVISFHMDNGTWHWLVGNNGVTVFFVLSGYLITMLALREERSRGRLSIAAFYVRRVFRLLPLYYVVLAVYCVLIFGLNGFSDRRRIFALALPYYLTYLQEFVFFGGNGGGNGPVPPFLQTWSLGIEEKFYLVWPVLAFIFWRRSVVTRSVGTVILTVVTMFAQHIFGRAMGRFLHPYSLILVGCLTALLLDNPFWFRRLAWLGRSWAGGVATLAFLFIHYRTRYADGFWIRNAEYPLAVAVLLVALVLGEGPIQRFLRIPFLVMIGRLSYGMYLVHLLAVRVAERVVRRGPENLVLATVALLLACAVSIVGAYCLSVLIERPGIAIGRRLSAALLRQVTPVAANESPVIRSAEMGG
jgi:peptidoglycan/LPS O-acetylase OafA/YrhL